MFPLGLEKHVTLNVTMFMLNIHTLLSYLSPTSRCASYVLPSHLRLSVSYSLYALLSHFRPTLVVVKLFVVRFEAMFMLYSHALLSYLRPS